VGSNRTITVTPTADRNGGSVTITLTVSDGVLTSQRIFTVDVLAMNDLPIITPQNFVVNENSVAGTVVGSVVASDIDAGAVLTYAIGAGNLNGAFAIDPVTGQITVVNPPVLDFETTPPYLLTVSVTDSVGTPQTETITIDLNDLNEVPTSLLSSHGAVDENSPLGTRIGTLSSTDIDAGDSATYSLVDDAGGLFAVYPNTGEITVNGSLDFETSANHTIIARITDKGGLVLDRSFIISLVDIHEAPVLVGDTFGLAENSANGAFVGTLVATDVDAGDTLTFSLVGGNTGGAFAIDTTTGVISVANGALLDFESQSVFSLTAQVADAAGLIQQQSVTVNLSDLNERPTLGASHFHIPEWSAVGTAVGVVSASDVDAGDFLTYSFVSGNTGGRFVIDPATGQISVANATNFTFESRSSYTISVRVQDAGDLTQTSDITLVIDNVNVAPVAIDDRYILPESTTLKTTVMTGVLANDSDVDPSSITAVLVQGPRLGTLTFRADGTFTYVPDSRYFGRDSFTYQATDGLESSGIVTVTLEVELIAPGGGGLGRSSDSETDDSSETDSGGGSGSGDNDSDRNSGAAISPLGTGTGTGAAGGSSNARSSGSPEGETEVALLPTLGAELIEDIPEAGQASDLLKSLSQGSRKQKAGVRDRAIHTLSPVLRALLPDPIHKLSASILENHVMWNQLDSIRNQLHEQGQASVGVEDFVVGTTTAVTGGLTVGYVIWLIRGGSLLATMVSVVPSWMSFDPLPVMERFEEDLREEDQESLASIVAGSAGARS